MRLLIVSEAARRIPGARPKDISDLFYLRKLDDARCPIVGGRRLIPHDYLPQIEAALRAAGRLLVTTCPPAVTTSVERGMA
jgi:hypothetical protein